LVIKLACENCPITELGSEKDGPSLEFSFKEVCATRETRSYERCFTKELSPSEECFAIKGCIKESYPIERSLNERCFGTEFRSFEYCITKEFSFIKRCFLVENSTSKVCFSIKGSVIKVKRFS